MAILSAVTSNMKAKVAECPYTDCDGVRPYYLHPTTDIPIPLGENFESSRASYAVGFDKETTDPFNVTFNRTKTLINVGEENERYKVEDSFTIPGETWEVDSLKGSVVFIDYPDPVMARRLDTQGSVKSNTADTITLYKPITAAFEATLADVNVTVRVLDRTNITKKEIKNKLWDSYLFFCPECKKPFYVDKP